MPKFAVKAVLLAKRSTDDKGGYAYSVEDSFQLAQQHHFASSENKKDIKKKTLGEIRIKVQDEVIAFGKGTKHFKKCNLATLKHATDFREELGLIFAFWFHIDDSSSISMSLGSLHDAKKNKKGGAGKKSSGRLIIVQFYSSHDAEGILKAVRMETESRSINVKYIAYDSHYHTRERFLGNEFNYEYSRSSYSSHGEEEPINEQIYGSKDTIEKGSVENGRTRTVSSSSSRSSSVSEKIVEQQQKPVEAVKPVEEVTVRQKLGSVSSSSSNKSSDLADETIIYDERHFFYDYATNEAHEDPNGSMYWYCRQFPFVDPNY